MALFWHLSSHMNLVRPLLSIGILLLVLSACGPMASLDDSCECGFYTNSSGEMVHWNDGAQIELKFNRKFPYAKREAFVTAVETYNELLSTTSLHINEGEEEAPAISGNKADSVSGDGINGVY